MECTNKKMKHHDINIYDVLDTKSKDQMADLLKNNPSEECKEDKSDIIEERILYKPTKFTIYPKLTLSYCINCGKYGHIYSNCIDPTTSVGIICFKVVERTKVSDFDTHVYKLFSDLLELDEKGYVKLKYISGIPLEFLSPSTTVDCYNTNNNRLLNTFIKYHNSVKFLLVQRKYSLGYIVLMKGKWNINDREGLIDIFQQMTPSEIKGLLEYGKSCDGFDMLWKEFWTNKTHRKYELNYLKNKFSSLVNHKSWNLEFYCSLVKSVNTPEWGFPKGRRMYKEDNLNCAIREFREETGLVNVNILKKVKTLQEDMIGTNGEEYRHIYHIGFVNENTEVKHNPSVVESHKCEIGNVGWMSYIDSIKLLNKHHHRKKYILTQIYLFIIMRLLKSELK